MRALFGGDPNLNETNGIVRLNKASQTVTIWDAETGGTQYTNLLAFDGTTAISSVTSTGRTLAPFYGEDNDIAHAWADTGDGDRELILGTFPGAALSAAYASKGDARAVRASDVYYTGPVVTFVNDDSDPLFHDVWEVIAAEKGIKISLAAVAGRITGEYPVVGYPSMTLAELQAIEANGHDVFVHGYAHLESNDPAVTPAMLDEDFARARAYADENFPTNADIMVWPGGVTKTNADKKAAARKHFRYAINASGGPMNPAQTPVDNWAIERVNGDTLTEAQLKAHIDTVVANNGWLVVMTHDKELDASGRAASMTKLRNVIDYCGTVGAEILKFTEAEKVKGNAVAIGEHTQAGSTFIGRMGRTRWNGAQGMWTPTIYGTGTPGAHTYAQQKGYYQVEGGMVTVKCAITITDAGWDAATTGNLRISGLPFEATALDLAACAPVKYGHYNLGANYSTIWAQASGSFCHLFVTGNNVGDKYMDTTALVAGANRVIQFTMTYMLADPAWV